MFLKRYLENGMPVVMEQLPIYRSVIIGIWVKVGSRHESSRKSGISHFLEHMFFKGTKKRTATDIAMHIDSLGGDLNAFTSREQTAFYVKVLDEYIERGVELLSDIFLHSTFLDEEIEKEKGVIEEEIKLVEDTPDDYIHDLFSRAIWGESGLGQPVLGTRDTIRTYCRDDLIRHVRRYYGTSDTVVAVAGNFNAEETLKLLDHHLGKLRRGSEPEPFPPSAFRGKVCVYPKDLSEVHFCLGVQGIPFGSDERYALALLNAILGASVSSRLFQEIREKKGYAYSVYSFMSSYRDTGYWAVYAGVGKKKLNTVIDLVAKEMNGLSSTLTESELRRAKDQIKGNIVLGLESTSSRMQNIARQEIYFGTYLSEADIMRSIEEVTLPRIRDIAHRLVNGAVKSLVVLGPVEEKELAGWNA